MQGDNLKGMSVVLNVPTQKLKRFRPTVQDSFEAPLCHRAINTAGRGVERVEMKMNLKI